MEGSLASHDSECAGGVKTTYARIISGRTVAAGLSSRPSVLRAAARAAKVNCHGKNAARIGNRYLTFAGRKHVPSINRQKKRRHRPSAGLVIMERAIPRRIARGNTRVSREVAV